MSTFVTTEMHTCGQPIRIVEKGFPKIEGDTLQKKMDYLIQEHDHLRKLLMWEPRGHFDLIGVILVQPDYPEADIGAIFMHNEGYGPMCGDATISLGRYLVDKGIVRNPSIPKTVVKIQCPCGLIEARVQNDGKKTGAVSFLSVPSFLYEKDVSVNVSEFGQIVVDIAYGGGFYAIVPASQFNLEHKCSCSKLKEVAGALLDELRTNYKVVHPENNDACNSYIYGIIVTDGKDGHNEEVTTNFTLYADKAVGRAPCGSGSSARIAQQFGRGLIKLDQTRIFKSRTGGRYKATSVKAVKCGDFDAVVVEVSGNGYYTGTSSFSLEENDEIGKGFLMS
ncbi:trans-L-3-hydroxyproline dehydratase-like [Mytilus californianus]|uniref:trans-L-3-hydroxyproline dehydratase-like n=1 Tax=Mytilus californianus TaxID=6549 RepID=UPI002248145E|nr:trans-L-3-hydroxyproline dehydratase-like [Mytilus californianus]